jgi:hypothetical protein
MQTHGVANADYVVRISFCCCVFIFSQLGTVRIVETEVRRVDLLKRK